MKKKKIGVVATSVAAIAVCSSMIVGSTFALFTSEDKVSVTVTSGKVNVTASVGELTATTSLNAEYEAKNSEMVAFENGGFASVDGGKITLNSIMPGDTLTFPVTVKNNSNVKVMSRVMYKVESGYLLASGLDITVNEKALTGKQEYSTGWAELETTTYNFEISLPNHEGKLDNLYQDLSTEISFSVEAVQANAVKAGEGDVDVDLPDYTDLRNAFVEGKAEKVSDSESLLDTLSNGEAAILTGDITDTTAVGIAQLTDDSKLELNGYAYSFNKLLEVGDLTDHVSNNVIIENGTLIGNYYGIGAAAMRVDPASTLTLKNVKVDASKGTYAIGIRGNVAEEDKGTVILDNCEIECGVAVGSDAVSSGLYQNVDIQILNTTINAIYTGILLNVPGTITIENSTITAVDQAVFARGGDITVKNSTLKTTCKYTTAQNSGYDTAWGNGTFANSGALVIGNKNNSSYKYPTKVTLENVTLVASDVAPAIYMWGDTQYASTLIYDAETAKLIEGDAIVAGVEKKLEANGGTITDGGNN